MELSICLLCVAQAAALLVVANGAPVLASNLFGGMFEQAVDLGWRFTDGRELFGASKTWRGLVVAVVCGGLAAPVLGMPVATGLAVAALAMAGDLLASFSKRRLGMPRSSRSRGLDVVPESLLPVAVLHAELGLNIPGIVLVVLIFWLIEISLSPVLHRWHIRARPW